MYGGGYTVPVSMSAGAGSVFYRKDVGLNEEEVGCHYLGSGYAGDDDSGNGVCGERRFNSDKH